MGERQRAGRIAQRTPKLGEHSREILVELGFDDGKIAELVRSGTTGALAVADRRNLVWPIVLIVVGLLFSPTTSAI